MNKNNLKKNNLNFKFNGSQISKIQDYVLEKSFFFIQKMAKIQDNVNPGHCEIQ